MIPSVIASHLSVPDERNRRKSGSGRSRPPMLGHVGRSFTSGALLMKPSHNLARQKSSNSFILGALAGKPSTTIDKLSRQKSNNSLEVSFPEKRLSVELSNFSTIMVACNSQHPDESTQGTIDQCKDEQNVDRKSLEIFVDGKHCKR